MRHLEPEDILRQALHQVAESVEPAPDGLARIHARLSAPHPLMVARLMAGWETLRQFMLLRLEFVMLRLEPARAALVSWLDRTLPTVHGRLHVAAGRLRPLTERLRPVLDWSIAALAWLGRLVQPRTAPEGRPSRWAWLRSIAAMTTVVLVAVVTGVALSVLPHQIVREAQSVFSSQTNGSGGGSTHAPETSGGGHQLGAAPAAPTPSPTVSSGSEVSPRPSASCTPTPMPTPTVSPTPTPTVSPTPTPTPTVSPTPTPSPSDSGDDPSSSSTDQGGQPAAATQSAQVSAAVFITGLTSAGSRGKGNPSPPPSC